MAIFLAYSAFEALVSRLTKAPALSVADIKALVAGKDDYPTSAPLFVTWYNNGDLRGCIGTFSALPLEEAIPKYALISAFDDERFTPISEKELPHLSVSITVLDNFMPIIDPINWKIGEHGLKVLFLTESGHYLGTFLPLVAEEQKWDHIDTLWNLIRKAGHRAPAREQTVEFYKGLIERRAMELVRYDGLKVGAIYAEYASFRNDYDKSRLSG